MSGLTVGGTIIPIAVSNQTRDRADWVDRSRAFDGTYRASLTGGAVREWKFQTPVISTRATADVYEAALSIVTAQTCSGDILSIPTMCCSEITGWTPVALSNGSHGVVIDFTLHEVQPAKILFKYTPGDTLVSETFARTGNATYHDSSSVVQTAGTGVKRDGHFVAPGVQSLLLEDTATNVCLQSENFGTTWVAVGTPTRAGGTNTASGISLDTIGDDDAAAVEGYRQAITYTGDGAKGVSLYVRQGTSTSTAIRCQDTTAVADRLLGILTWSGGLPSVAMTTGTYLGYDSLAGTTFRLLFKTTSITAANTNEVQIYPATNAAFAVANTGNVYAGGVQCENGTFPTSYIKTTTIPVTRNADSYSITFSTNPQELTAYIKGYERGTSLSGTNGVLSIGGSTNASFIVLNGGAGPYQSIHRRSADVSSTVVATPNINDLIELRALLFGDGSTQLGQTVNLGTEANATQSGVNSLASTWNANTLWVNERSGSKGTFAFTSIKVVAGMRSLYDMRNL